MMRLLRIHSRSVLAWTVAAAAGLPALGTAPARAAEGFVVGDSIAADLAAAVGLKFIAHQSVSLRRNAPRNIGPQLARLPKGDVILMGLGLNDAAIPVQGLRNDIDWVIAGALRSGEKVVWFGPPCVMKRWDNLAREMDAYLRRRLASTAIQYVSLRDPQICQPAMRTRDGEHFTAAGYRYLWAKIRRESSYAASIELPKQPIATVAAPARPARGLRRRRKAAAAG
jgi:hypothetical protein